MTSRVSLLTGLALIVAILGAAAAEGAQPTPDQRACIGSFQSALARSGASSMVRDERTGALLMLHQFDGDLNPGDFGGGSGWLDILTETGVVSPERPESSCVVPVVPVIKGCIDFSATSDCSAFLVDADADGYVDGAELGAGSDPADPESTPESALLDEQTGSSTCGDHDDNDLDVSRDSADAGCRLTCADFGNTGRCSDDDADGWLLYVEEEYGSDPNNPASTPESTSVDGTCSDRLDNDGDGRIDEADCLF